MQQFSAYLTGVCTWRVNVVLDSYTYVLTAADSIGPCPLLF